jgi:hypothetical protein
MAHHQSKSRRCWRLKPQMAISEYGASQKPLIVVMYHALSAYSTRKSKGSLVRLGLLGRRTGALSNIPRGKYQAQSLDCVAPYTTFSFANVFYHRQTCAWDVRTKRVSYESVPTTDDVAAICNYGATATLFTVGRNFSIQQYDMNPSNGPATMVANVQHAPANTPPSPPNSLDEQNRLRDMDEPTTARPLKTAPKLLATLEVENEVAVMSPLQKIAQEMDQLEEERRDRLGPLSPVSSRGSQSSRSSGGSGRAPRYRYDKPISAAKSSRSSGAASGTVFSSGTSSFAGTSAESISIRSTSSAASSRYGNSALRKEVLRSPEEVQKPRTTDLFPFTKARLTDVPFRPTELGPERTPDDLRLNMLRVVFGWDNEIDELIRDERKYHHTTRPPYDTSC